VRVVLNSFMFLLDHDVHSIDPAVTTTGPVIIMITQIKDRSQHIVTKS